MKTLAPLAPASASVPTTSVTPLVDRSKLVLGPLVVDLRSATAALLSGIALMGRILMFVTDGRASATQLIAVLLIGASACAVGTNALTAPGLRGFSKLLARVGQRAGAVQVALSLISLALLV